MTLFHLTVFSLISCSISHSMNCQSHTGWLNVIEDATSLFQRELVLQRSQSHAGGERWKSECSWYILVIFDFAFNITWQAVWGFHHHLFHGGLLDHRTSTEHDLTGIHFFVPFSSFWKSTLRLFKIIIFQMFLRPNVILYGSSESEELKNVI